MDTKQGNTPDREEDRLSSGEHAPSGVARQLSELARELQAGSDPSEVMQGIVDAAVFNVPGAEYAGITLVSRHGDVSTPAQTDALVGRIDEIQYETGQGPCLSTAREHLTVRADDLRHEDRWPKFAANAAEAGVRSMLSVQLFVRDDDLGALNLYAAEPGAFDEESEDVGLLLAAHAALAMVGIERQGNLRAALTNRDVIGQAKGILMERHKIGPVAAFQLLIRASQQNNRKLSAVAAMVANTGQEPELAAKTDA